MVYIILQLMIYTVKKYMYPLPGLVNIFVLTLQPFFESTVHNN